jgi:hypothetical protein
MSFGNPQSKGISRALGASDLDKTALSDSYRPFNARTGFGNTLRQNGEQQFNISDSIMKPLETAYTNANTAYGSSLGNLVNPQGAMDEARQIYANYMLPAFNKQSEINQGNQHASLGNAYASTFGQLTQHQAGLDDAIAKANLDAQIYDKGNQRYTQMLADNNALGNAQAQAGNAYYQPYQNLQSILDTSANVAQNWTNMVADIYKGKIGTAGSIVQKNTPSGGGLASTIGSLAPLLSFIPGVGPPLSAAASLAAGAAGGGGGGGIKGTGPIQSASGLASFFGM